MPTDEQMAWEIVEQILFASKDAGSAWALGARDVIATAISAARAQGRREGLELTAKIEVGDMIKQGRSAWRDARQWLELGAESDIKESMACIDLGRASFEDAILALSTKLAVAIEAMKPFEEHAKDRVVDAPEWRGSDTVKIVVGIDELREIAAAIRALGAQS